MANKKTNEKLGMDYGTASNRLKINLLFDFAIKAGHKCYRCNQDLTRDTFTVEHKEPWLNSENPQETFFDIDNIAYSHSSCNFRAASRPTKKYFTVEERLEADRQLDREYARRKYTPERRRARYERSKELKRLRDGDKIVM